MAIVNPYINALTFGFIMATVKMRAIRVRLISAPTTDLVLTLLPMSQQAQREGHLDSNQPSTVKLTRTVTKG